MTQTFKAVKEVGEGVSERIKRLKVAVISLRLSLISVQRFILLLYILTKFLACHVTAVLPYNYNRDSNFG